MINIKRALEQSVTSAYRGLVQLSEEDASRKPAPGKWSPKEIIGHLIDSAMNNHRRFVLGQTQARLVFDGYDQEAWVLTQNYQQMPWPELLLLWKCYNLHLARLISMVPEEIAHRVSSAHNFDKIAFKTVPSEQPASLAYLMEDYVNHLNHHLRQLPD